MSQDESTIEELSFIYRLQARLSRFMTGMEKPKFPLPSHVYRALNFLLGIYANSLKGLNYEEKKRADLGNNTDVLIHTVDDIVSN